MNSTYLFVALIVVCFVALSYAARRALVICELVAEHGTLRVVRGGLRPNVLGDLRDVARHDRLDGIRIYVTKSGGQGRVEVRGAVRADAMQRLRNVIGTVPLAKLLAKG